MDRENKSPISHIPIEEDAPVWIDEDDHNDKQLVNLKDRSHLRKLRLYEEENAITKHDLEKRLRKFHNTLQQPSWATIPEEDTPKADPVPEIKDELYRTNAPITRNKRSQLRPGSIQTTRVPDANVSRYSKSVITTVRFHPNNELLMSAGMDKTVKLYHIDCDSNPVVHSMLFEDTQIYCADFINNSTEILATGRKRHLFSYNIETNQAITIPSIPGREEAAIEFFVPSHDQKYVAFIGINSAIVVLSSITKHVVAEIIGHRSLADIAWSSDDTLILATGYDGKIYVYDIATRKTMYEFADEGAVHGTALATSLDGRYLAAGSTSGVVNVYDTDFENFKVTDSSSTDADDFYSYYSSYSSHSSSAKKPLKALMNLTTTIDQIVFSPTTEIMAISSREKKDSLRLIHLPSLTTLTGWPSMSTPLSYVQDVAISPDSSLIAIANDKGKILLYQLDAFSSSRRRR